MYRTRIVREEIASVNEVVRIDRSALITVIGCQVARAAYGSLNDGIRLIEVETRAVTVYLSHYVEPDLDGVISVHVRDDGLS